MRELSLHILDLAQNSIEAGAKNLVIDINEDEKGFFVFRIRDDGRGMSEEMVRQVRDPFVTSRLTRKVGMGIPFIDMVARQCGGRVDIFSTPGKGTEIAAYFERNNIDRPPLGNIVETIKVLLAGASWIDLIFYYRRGIESMVFKTSEVRDILGDDADFTEPALYKWLEEYLQQEIARVKGREE